MRRLFSDRRGSVITMAGLMLPVLIGLGAFAVDAGNLYFNKSKVQMAADAAALGAVFALPDATAAATNAIDLVNKNTPTSFGTLSKTQDVTVGLWDASTKSFTPNSANANAVKVTTHRSAANGNPVLTYFGSFVGASQFDVSATSIAVRFGGACVRVLDRTATNAFYVSGNGSTTLNCSLQVDSSATSAARTQGSSSVTSTKEACIVGGYSGNGWSPTPTTGCKVLGDPLASVPEPSAPAAACSLPSGGGTMAGNCTITGTVSASGTINLQSGLYYLKGANLTVSNNAVVTGSGVMFFVDANSTISLGGGGSVSLSAGTSGSYAGILIFQSRSTPVTTAVTIWGGGSLSLNGTLYAPSATLNLGGNGSYSSTAQFGYLIADKITLGGSSSFVFNAFPTTGANPRTLRVHAGLVH